MMNLVVPQPTILRTLTDNRLFPSSHGHDVELPRLGDQGQGTAETTRDFRPGLVANLGEQPGRRHHGGGLFSTPYPYALP